MATQGNQNKDAKKGQSATSANTADAKSLKDGEQNPEEVKVSGDELKGQHLQGDELEGGTKQRARDARKKLADAGDEGVEDGAGRKLQEVVVHPHRQKQPHRIEQEFPEVELVYGDLPEDKKEVLAEAHAKGVSVDILDSVEDIRSAIDEEEEKRTSESEANQEPVGGFVNTDFTYQYGAQYLELRAGQRVDGGLAQKLRREETPYVDFDDEDEE